MVKLLVEMSEFRKNAVSFKFENEEERALFLESSNPFDFLEKVGRADLERRIAINTIGLALYSDALHFLYEALIALEKRKFSVSLALLRKPLKENLVMAAWVCADEVDFFEKLKSNPRDSFDQRVLSSDRKISIFKAALEKFWGPDFITAEQLHSIIYDRTNEWGFAALFDKATHLITRNNSIATENYNINFIFRNPMDNDIYEGIYSDLARILLVYHLIQIEIYSRMDFAKENI